MTASKSSKQCTIRRGSRGRKTKTPDSELGPFEVGPKSRCAECLRCLHDDQRQVSCSKIIELQFAPTIRTLFSISISVRPETVLQVCWDLLMHSIIVGISMCCPDLTTSTGGSARRSQTQSRTDNQYNLLCSWPCKKCPGCMARAVCHV